MADKVPLKLEAGQVSQYQTGDTIPPAFLPGGSSSDPPEGSYAPGSYTVATGKFRMAVKRQQLTTTERITLNGTARLSIRN